MKDRNEFLNSLKVDTNVIADDRLDISSFSQNNNQDKDVKTSSKKKVKKPNNNKTRPRYKLTKNGKKFLKILLAATVLGGAATGCGKSLNNDLFSKPGTGDEEKTPANTDLTLENLELLPKEKIGDNVNKQLLYYNDFVSDYNSDLRKRLDDIHDMIYDNPDSILTAGELLKQLASDVKSAKMKELIAKCAYSASKDVRETEGLGTVNSYDNMIDNIYPVNSEDDLINPVDGPIRILYTSGR